LVRLDLVPGRPSADELAQLDRLLDERFQHRRKTLLRILGDRLGSRPRALELCAHARVDPRARPEVLSVRELLELASSPLWRQPSGE
jgi:16S rRNA A1518/A1519 N6-dimethyltransferase RsmA/KsgA/DIM1 with predicted DNA glycosylase/AP lyase activity